MKEKLPEFTDNYYENWDNFGLKYRLFIENGIDNLLFENIDDYEIAYNDLRIRGVKFLTSETAITKKMHPLWMGVLH